MLEADDHGNEYLIGRTWESCVRKARPRLRISRHVESKVNADAGDGRSRRRKSPVRGKIYRAEYGSRLFMRPLRIFRNVSRALGLGKCDILGILLDEAGE